MATQPESVVMVAECGHGCAPLLTLNAGDKLASHTRCNEHGAAIFYRLARADERAANDGD